MIARAGVEPSTPATVVMPQSSILHLRDGVHAALVEHDLVLLDVDADGYFCLPGPLDLVALPSGRLLTAQPELVQVLDGAGLLGEALCASEAVMTQLGEPPAAPRLPRAGRSAFDAALPPPRPRDLLDACACLADLAWRYRGRTFRQILAAAVRPPGMAPAMEPTPALLKEAQRFRSWIPYAPVRGKCLLRSFMLLRRLRRRGLDAWWVIAVRTWPFAAHCWLQVGDTVLDDDVERLVAFEPILIL